MFDQNFVGYIGLKYGSLEYSTAQWKWMERENYTFQTARQI
jgi:hypothetical protein